MVTSLSRVTLETASTESGLKDYIAVGTTVNRGEDLAARGAVRYFVFMEIFLANGLFRLISLKSLRLCQIRRIRLQSEHSN